MPPPVQLFAPGKLGEITVRNRIVMAPMTRSRASADGVPADFAGEYYAQRAAAGLIITEGTAPSVMGSGYARTPGIYSPEQVAAWTAITGAVHAAGGRIFLQLMHVGRIAHSANRLTTALPVAPSAIRAKGQMWTDDLGMQDFDQPRALEKAEIPAVIEEFAAATRNAIAAGFDGVELHAASGYLPHQFLSPGTNFRTDVYGGPGLKRIRFVVEALEAMKQAAGGGGRVGIKISPSMQFNDIQDNYPAETYGALVEAIAPLKLAYLHVMKAWPEVFKFLRPLHRGTFLAGGGYDLDSAQEALADGSADFIVFGKPFIANPDLPERFERRAILAEPDVSTFYTPGPKGYTDYPKLVEGSALPAKV